MRRDPSPQGLAFIHSFGLAWHTGPRKISRDILYGPPRLSRAAPVTRPTTHVGVRYYLADFRHSGLFQDITDVLAESPRAFTFKDAAARVVRGAERAAQRAVGNLVEGEDGLERAGEGDGQGGGEDEGEGGQDAEGPVLADRFPFSHDIYNLGDFFNKHFVRVSLRLPLLSLRVQKLTSPSTVS